MNKFIDSLNLDDLQPLAVDMSRRSYFKGVKDGQESLIMVYPQGAAADKAELMSFVEVSEWLQAQGLNAPEIYAYDESLASAQVGMLGKQSFGDLCRAGQEMKPLYEIAAGVLKTLKDTAPPEFLKPFKGSKIDGRLSQFIEYYMPLVQGEKGNREEFFAAWQKMEEALPACPQTFQHMDFHLENLMWCPEQEGIKRCGLIDFQDAVLGPMPYDLVNLLEDARVDVDPALKAGLIARFCEGMGAEEYEVFDSWYAVMALHFHCRVLGLFVMAAVERNKDEYIEHLPRLQKYILSRIDHPALQPVTAWFAQEGLDFAPLNDLNGDSLRQRFPQGN